MRLGSQTHSVEMEQRYLPLSFTAGAGTLTASVPANMNTAVPGIYMLFIVDSNGVPSVARMVQVDSAPRLHPARRPASASAASASAATSASAAASATTRCRPRAHEERHAGAAQPRSGRSKPATSGRARRRTWSSRTRCRPACRTPRRPAARTRLRPASFAASSPRSLQTRRPRSRSRRPSPARATAGSSTRLKSRARRPTRARPTTQQARASGKPIRSPGMRLADPIVDSLTGTATDRNWRDRQLSVTIMVKKEALNDTASPHLGRRARHV